MEWKKNTSNTQTSCCRHRQFLINNSNFLLGSLHCKCSLPSFLMLHPSARYEVPETMTIPAIHQRMPSSQSTSWMVISQRNAHQKYNDFKWKRLSQAWLENLPPILLQPILSERLLFFSGKGQTRWVTTGRRWDSVNNLASIRELAQVGRQSIHIYKVLNDTYTETICSLASATVAYKKFKIIRKDNILLQILIKYDLFLWE